MYSPVPRKAPKSKYSDRDLDPPRLRPSSNNNSAVVHSPKVITKNVVNKTTREVPDGRRLEGRERMEEKVDGRRYEGRKGEPPSSNYRSKKPEAPISSEEQSYSYSSDPTHTDTYTYRTEIDSTLTDSNHAPQNTKQTFGQLPLTRRANKTSDTPTYAKARY
jgi:hypothetical protein